MTSDVQVCHCLFQHAPLPPPPRVCYNWCCTIGLVNDTWPAVPVSVLCSHYMYHTDPTCTTLHVHLCLQSCTKAMYFCELTQTCIRRGQSWDRCWFLFLVANTTMPPSSFRHWTRWKPALPCTARRLWWWLLTSCMHNMRRRLWRMPPDAECCFYWQPCLSVINPDMSLCHMIVRNIVYVLCGCDYG